MSRAASADDHRAVPLFELASSLKRANRWSARRGYLWLASPVLRNICAGGVAAPTRFPLAERWPTGARRDLPARPDHSEEGEAIIADLGVDKSTLSDWIARGDFPEPLVLNPGQKREIIGWPTSVYQTWKASLAQRAAKPITQAAYTDEARAKGQRTRAAKRAGSAPEPTPPAPHRVKRPRGVSR